jgi:hypothetical protein
MTTASEHLAKYPNARGKTLAYLIQRDRKNAELRIDIERRVDRQVAAAFKTFAINVWRAYCAGRL